MLFNSINFLIYFPIVVLAYFLIPHRIRYIWMLAASYYFYMCWNPTYALLIAFSTLITYISGILLERFHEHKRLVVFFSFFINLAILFFFKYFDFTIDSINTIANALNLSTISVRFDVMLPVGISFYTFQALSYTMDVYRKEIKAEKNILKYALFVSFFPQLVAGPIERSKNLINQIHERHYFDYNRMLSGLQLMLWGYFQKLVIADRVAILVNEVYNNIYEYAGFQIVIATVFFAFQVYCDFASYSNIAIGAAEVMGFRLMKNFNHPYLATSVTDFWRRWHISLTTWFRDYLYIPLGGNRKGKVRQYLNTMIVFLTSGLWHGASWTYIIWGGLNGVYQIIEKQTGPLRERIAEKFHINRNVLSHKLLKWISTFVLVDFSWIFFRANTTREAFVAIRQIFAKFNPWIFFDDSLFEMGLSRKNFYVVIWSLVLLFVISVLQERGISIREKVKEQGIWLQWTLGLGLIFVVIVYGIYGIGYDCQPVYILPILGEDR